MVSGLIVGAMIALLFFTGGYFCCKYFRFSKDKPVGINIKEDYTKTLDCNSCGRPDVLSLGLEKESLLTSIQELDRENEILRMEIERDRMKKKKKAMNEFRTTKGLLSYKKYIRE